MSTTTCELADNGAAVRMRSGDWGTSFPTSDLANWVRLYRGLRDRDGGRYAAIYAPAVDALVAVAAKAGVAIPPEKI